MFTEIERRWLLDLADVGTLKAVRSIDIFQGYLTTPASGFVLRLRIASEAGKRTLMATYKGRKKTHNLGVRELNIPLPMFLAPWLLRYVKSGLRKTRHVIPYGDLAWEVDVFHDQLEGLAVVELEMPMADYPVSVPSFFGPEITKVKGLSNAACAFSPDTALALARSVKAGLSVC